jgi:hypothetical protein
VTTDPDVRNQREEEPVTAEPHLDPLPAEVFDKLRRVHTRVKAGEALWGVYPPSEQTLAEYRAAAAAGNGGHGRNVEAPTT